jgi:hypothetical protein
MKMSVQARLDQESQQALEKLQRRLGLSQSEIVRESLRLMVKHYAPPRRKRIIGLGEFESGISDLGSNKKHLEGFGRKSMNGQGR